MLLRTTPAVTDPWYQALVAGDLRLRQARDLHVIAQVGEHVVRGRRVEPGDGDRRPADRDLQRRRHRGGTEDVGAEVGQRVYAVHARHDLHLVAGVPAGDGVVAEIVDVEDIE